MPWARVDDNFFTHPKARRAWRCRPSLGLHMLALSYCMRHETDGIVAQEFVEDQLPDAGERTAAVDALVQSGLWERNSHGWVIHDFADYNPLKADMEARREADKRRKQEERDRGS